MKVCVKQNQLAQGLGIVSKAVAPRSTLPVLGNILVATDEGRLRLSATNLELGITHWIGARIDEEGSTTVPARTFADLVNNLRPGDDVILSLDTRTQTMTVRSGTSVTEIKGIDAQEFPPIPVPDLSEGVQVNVQNIKEMIQQVAFAASTDEARPVLTGVMVSINGNTMSMAATDGFRISVRRDELSASVNRPVSAIVPARALNELARVLTDSDKTVTMITPQGRGQVIFHLQDTELVSQLIEGSFPPYEAIIPKSFKTRTVLKTAQLLNACKQAEIIAREGSNIARLNVNPGGDMQPGSLQVTAHSEETGQNEVAVDATVDGVPLLIAFNVRYLREVLEVIKTEDVSIETNAPNTPGMIKPVGGILFQHVIMPMHMG